MTKQWSPITGGKVKVEGVDPQAVGLLRVSMLLTPNPVPRAWAEFFNSAVGVITSFSMHPITADLHVVQIRCADNEMEKYVAAARERIAAANEHYERLELPKIRLREEAEKAAADATAARLEAARKKAESL